LQNLWSGIQEKCDGEGGVMVEENPGKWKMPQGGLDLNAKQMRQRKKE